MRITITLDGEETYTQSLDRRLHELGISYGELSRASGIHHTQLSRWRNTNQEPSWTNIRRIEEAIIEIRLARRRKRKP